MYYRFFYPLTYYTDAILTVLLEVVDELSSFSKG